MDLIKSLKRSDISRLKDLIIAHPNAIVRYRGKLVYAGDVKTKSGKLMYKFVNNDFGRNFYVDEDDIVYKPLKGKVIPLDHKIFTFPTK